METNKATKVLIILSDDLESQSISIRKVAFQQKRSVIKTTDTRHTAQTAFRAIEEKIARPWLGTVPFWPWKIDSRAYHLEMDVICNRYKDEITKPWGWSLIYEGEKSIIGTIELSSKVAKDLVDSALRREDQRYNRELEGKDKPIDQGAVQHLITTYGNLVAAEAALAELLVHIREKARNGQ